MPIKITIAGATGWTGSAVSHAVHHAKDLTLVGAISPSQKNKKLADVLSIMGCEVPISGSVTEALQTPTDVMIDFTRADVVKTNVLCAIKKHVHVVIGTSGLTEDDYAEIDTAAHKYKVGVIAAGNFSLTAVLMMHFAEIAARYLNQWEIIDYASDSKIDAPSGTARELASRLSQIKQPKMTYGLNEIQGDKEARGAAINGTQIHSIRLPGYVLAAETIFGEQDEKLILRHEAGSSPVPYVAGTLLAARKVINIIGLTRGLDKVMDIF